MGSPRSCFKLTASTFKLPCKSLTAVRENGEARTEGTVEVLNSILTEPLSYFKFAVGPWLFERGGDIGVVRLNRGARSSGVSWVEILVLFLGRTRLASSSIFLQTLKE